MYGNMLFNFSIFRDQYTLNSQYYVIQKLLEDNVPKYALYTSQSKRPSQILSEVYSVNAADISVLSDVPRKNISHSRIFKLFSCPIEIQSMIYLIE